LPAPELSLFAVQFPFGFVVLTKSSSPKYHGYSVMLCGWKKCMPTQERVLVKMKKNNNNNKKRKQKCRGYSYSTLSTAIAMGSQILVALIKKLKIKKLKNKIKKKIEKKEVMW